jgi:hypothetical protein
VCVCVCVSEWDAPEEYNPEPDDEELLLLKKMGWTGR